jgi:hypothetical protein
MRARLVRGAVYAGIGVGIAKAVGGARQRRDARTFYDNVTIVPPASGSGWVATFPALIHRGESFSAVFAADRDAVRAALAGTARSGTALHPVTWSDGRALIMIQAVRFHEITSQHLDGPTLAAWPYGEVVIGPLVTRRPSPPMVPLLAGAPGIFPLAMPVTTREARDAGVAMGLPKFIADLDFDDEVTMRGVRAAEDGAEILDLTVDVDGPMPPRVMRQPWYSVVDGQLWETMARTHAYMRIQVGSRASRAARLELGTHPVADELRRLKLDDRPVATAVVVQVRGIMPAPKAIGPAEARRAYIGQEKPFGRYTVRYPHTDPVDQYGPRGLVESAAALGVRTGGTPERERELVGAK